MKINYVHCFIAQDQQFLMLRRNNPPFKNMWNCVGGMYIFVANQFTGDLTECAEGTLAWKSKEWIMESPEVVSSVRTILDDVLATDVPVEYALFYTGAEYEGDLWKYVVFGNCEYHDS